ncbi:ORF6C domain-containing protein [Bacillus sp. FJAT-49705]|uniref:ORF6C domain-containing protein n=1 Tax=Cytobacillus citreus TaxID=2833586 RepID=A0ABS5NRA6_9BACI|nr:ORF6N domain-containing protein [Cytobacillus citreus]MBS4190352.1 ORF6C domain-containing protein [Cytobacillus citreus]
MKLKIIERNGLRALTTAQLAESYGTDVKVINRNFQRNSERYVHGKHYFSLTGDDLKEFKGSRQNDDSLKYASVLYLWTEKGAWLHAKSLNTNQAWNAYEMLVDDYYNVQQQVKILTEREQLIASMKLSLETAEEINLVKGEMNEIKNMVKQQITLDYGEQRRIQKAVGQKVYQLENKKSARASLFGELYKDIKDRFGVASYRDIKRKDMQPAIRYIEAWLPRKIT